MTDTFYGPRSRENARLLLDAAAELGYDPFVIRTTRGGYTAPQDVVEAVLGVADIEEGKNYPAPVEDASEGQDDGEDVTPPARPNNGASREDWKTYAESIGVEVVEDDKRDGIIVKVDAKEGSN